MNKQILFGIPGGFPLTQDTLSFMQSGQMSFGEALCRMHGHRYLIIEGCEVGDNNVVSPGMVVFDGEVLPFIGGALADKVTIVETRQQAAFQDGQTHEVYVTRVANFGASGAATAAWANFKPLNVILPADDGDVHENNLADGAVTTRKLADKAVTGAKIGNLTITSDNLAGQSVTDSKLKGIRYCKDVSAPFRTFAEAPVFNSLQYTGNDANLFQIVVGFKTSASSDVTTISAVLYISNIPNNLAIPPLTGDLNTFKTVLTSGSNSVAVEIYRTSSVISSHTIYYLNLTATPSAGITECRLLYFGALLQN